jgi:hypothetical protein
MTAPGSPSVLIINLVTELVGISGFNADLFQRRLVIYIPNKRPEEFREAIFETAQCVA